MHKSAEVQLAQLGLSYRRERSEIGLLKLSDGKCLVIPIRTHIVVQLGLLTFNSKDLDAQGDQVVSTDYFGNAEHIASTFEHHIKHRKLAIDERGFLLYEPVAVRRTTKQEKEFSDIVLPTGVRISKSKDSDRCKVIASCWEEIYVGTVSSNDTKALRDLISEAGALRKIYLESNEIRVPIERVYTPFLSSQEAVDYIVDITHERQRPSWAK